MYSFGFLARLICAGLAILFATSIPTGAQDRNRARCLSIVDINQRIDCLESGGTVSSGEGNPRPARILPLR
jgi:hypothetical protein